MNFYILMPQVGPTWHVRACFDPIFESAEDYDLGGRPIGYFNSLDIFTA